MCPVSSPGYCLSRGRPIECIFQGPALKSSRQYALILLLSSLPLVLLHSSLPLCNFRLRPHSALPTNSSSSRNTRLAPDSARVWSWCMTESESHRDRWRGPQSNPLGNARWWEKYANVHSDNLGYSSLGYWNSSIQVNPAPDPRYSSPRGCTLHLWSLSLHHPPRIGTWSLFHSSN
eukprot:775990-Prorocentrum_minimum.AAC.1